MRSISDNKGITLIVLIITIIVLLIIAGISISGAIQGIDQASDNRVLADLGKVQQAVTQRYTKYELTKDSSLLVGTKIDNSSLTGVPDSVNWKVFQATTANETTTNPERKYYRLSKADLNDLGLSGEYEGSSYVVNYYSGEVYDEGQIQTSDGKALYKTAIENEASELGDEYIKDGMQVWYDGINNTGSGHSSSTTTWKDLSGNGNDATIYNIATTPTSVSGWHSNYLALDGVDDFASKTGITISGANGTIEIIGKYISGDYIFRSRASGDKTYIRASATYKGSQLVTNPFNVSNNKKIYLLSSRIQKWYTTNNQSIFTNYFNNAKSQEMQFSGTQNGYYISIGSFVENKWNQGSKMQVYAIRIYNRALSDAEIHHNYILDKARYGIEE